MPKLPVAEHFQTMEQEAHAARLGMWIFLASEALLFAGLFALFATYRFHFPEGFAVGVQHNTKTFGSINTGVLLLSSYLAASSVALVRKGRVGLASLLVMATIALGGVFLAIKIAEYRLHFGEGIFPGGKGHFFAEHVDRGLPIFWTLYFVMTGLHAIHVVIGMVLLSSTLLGMLSGAIAGSSPQRIEVAALYWHLVDMVWIFLWPLFYLA
jgi:cytochrome c oxidase subunit 3